MKTFLNFIMSLLGCGILIMFGAVIGFWLEILLTPDLPNNFYECKDCGPRFIDLYRK